MSDTYGTTCWLPCDPDCSFGEIHCWNLHQPAWKWLPHINPCPMAMPEPLVGRVVHIQCDEHGVTFTAKLAPGWTLERIEEGLRQFFWGGPDDFDFNEIAMPEVRMDGGDQTHDPHAG